MRMKMPCPDFLRRVLMPTWTDLSPSLSLKEARLWSLVLASRFVPYRMWQKPESEGGGYSVQVQDWFAERAADEIRLFLAENVPDGRGLELVDLRPASGWVPTLFVMFLFVLFFWVYGRAYPGFGLYPNLWLKLGSADAGAILSGQWWRLATALTLHANGSHLAGNALIGGVFVWLACRRLGSGLAWFLTILAGVLGNLMNSMALGVHHNAIGFSTATFGAAGILAAIAPFGVGGGIHGLGRGSLVRRFLIFIRSALIPVAAGLGLLAMLGAGEETDLGAHLFGFLSGLGLGFVSGFLATRFGLPGKGMDAGLFMAALAIPAFAWMWAWLA
ncbi:MAG: rhomboid family intramembrane serine protease [Pseudodesulfovibrio sp.]|nr:rhomboid family intramembrane serine protease [Pseudodesulfovibrio sp.]